ncbi:hypothetical protein NDU88_002146 [Pleurodeles waltl]|uniref:Myb/SANT-like DNA-binding domain-containing protein n=1 Tax=Pleurodeles waltl TaxID=8319 RepID=A0AAV7M018_PLEWA|nr:hypothetical protein NDU88_002146 [Pleurodeles waltl]
MVEEIIRVEPQLFGSQVQHTTIARKAELWQRIVDRVNTVGQHPRNRDDIRKRWNDLRGKVRSMVSRHNIAVQKTGGGPPPNPPEFTAWEQEDPNANTPARRVQKCPSPPPEEAPSDDSSSVDLEPDDQPGPSGTSGQLVPHTQATADPTPSGNNSTAPTQRAHASVSRTGQSVVCLPLQGTQANPPPQQQQGPGGSGSGHTVQGTEAGGNRATRRAAVRQGGEERPREPTLQEALTTIMAAYHHSQETMATVLARFQEIQAQQEERYMGFTNQLTNISTAMGSIVQALNRIEDTLRDHVAPHRAPVTSPDQEQPTTSAGPSGQEAPPQRQATRTPPPAEEQPPRKRSLRSKK